MALPSPASTPASTPAPVPAGNGADGHGSGPTVRRIRFEYPAEMSPVWTPGRPEFSCAANSVSLLMPSVEPYFVRSIRDAIPDLPDDQVESCRAYLAQESQHHRQHVLFNRRLIEVYPALAGIDRAAQRFFRLLERRCSSRFNLAFAAGSETVAYSAARWAASRRRELFRNSDEVATSLFLWHLAEEVEHKSAAFEVYKTLHPSGAGAWLTRALTVVVSLLSLFAFVVAGTTVMLWAERLLHRPRAWFRLIRWGIGFAFEVLPNVAVSLTPGHHPDQFTDPAWFEVWLREYDSTNGTVPIWTSVPADR